MHPIIVKWCLNLFHQSSICTKGVQKAALSSRPASLLKKRIKVNLILSTFNTEVIRHVYKILQLVELGFPVYKRYTSSCYTSSFLFLSASPLKYLHQRENGHHSPRKNPERQVPNKQDHILYLKGLLLHEQIKSPYSWPSFLFFKSHL
jgi:hypothetical protein